MGANGNGRFLEGELVHRKVKVGDEWQTRTFPVVGGRLRILHENNDSLSIQTEIVRLDADFAVVKAAVESKKGKFNGTGTASSQRDAKLTDQVSFFPRCIQRTTWRPLWASVSKPSTNLYVRASSLACKLPPVKDD